MSKFNVSICKWLYFANFNFCQNRKKAFSVKVELFCKVYFKSSHVKTLNQSFLRPYCKEIKKSLTLKKKVKILIRAWTFALKKSWRWSKIFFMCYFFIFLPPGKNKCIKKNYNGIKFLWIALLAKLPFGYILHSDAFWPFLFHWGLDKPLLKIQEGSIRTLN